MNDSTKLLMTSKWFLVVQEYEAVKQKVSKNFSSVEEICRVYKVHRKDIRKYYERWVKGGRQRSTLLPRKRGPKHGSRKLLTKQQERTIMKIRRRLQANEYEIYHLVQSYFSVPPSISTIYRTWKRYPLNKKIKEKIKRYEKKYPGELGHSDTFRLPKTLFEDRKQRFLIGFIDDCTRLCYVELIPELRSLHAAHAFVRSLKWFDAHGIKIEALMTDNGSEFTAWNSPAPEKKHLFEVTMGIFNIAHKYIKPYCPQTNGKIERFWRLFKDQCVTLQEHTLTEKEFTEELKQFMYYYNYERIHGGIHYKTPFQKLCDVTELLK